MSVTVFLLVIWHGVVQFMMPMQDLKACFVNGAQLGVLMKPDPTLNVGCFDSMKQMFVAPPQNPLQAPPQMHEPQGPSPDRQAEERID